MHQIKSELVEEVFRLSLKLTQPLNKPREAVLVSQVYSGILQVQEESEESQELNADEVGAPFHREDT